MNHTINYSAADEVKGNPWLPVYFILLFSGTLLVSSLAEVSRQRQLESERVFTPCYVLSPGDSWADRSSLSYPNPDGVRSKPVRSMYPINQ